MNDLVFKPGHRTAAASIDQILNNLLVLYIHFQYNCMLLQAVYMAYGECFMLYWMNLNPDCI